MTQWNVRDFLEHWEAVLNAELELEERDMATIMFSKLYANRVRSYRAIDVEVSQRYL